MQNPFLAELSYYLGNAYPPFVYSSKPIRNYIPVFISHKVTEDEFEEKLIFLKENNYKTVTADKLNFPPQGPTICLTFDDGHRSVYEVAFPLLKRYGFCATVFIVPTYIDKPNWLTWEQIDEMNRSGIIDFQSHTLEHKRIPMMQADTILYDLTESKRILEERLDKPIQHLAYPYGRGSLLSQALSKKAGYLTNFWGPIPWVPYNKIGSDPYRLVRLKDDYILRLPGKDRKSIWDILTIKYKRRRTMKDIYS